MQYYACVATGCMLACERELGSPIASVWERVRFQLLLKLGRVVQIHIQLKLEMQKRNQFEQFNALMQSMLE